MDTEEEYEGGWGQGQSGEVKVPQQRLADRKQCWLFLGNIMRNKMSDRLNLHSQMQMLITMPGAHPYKGRSYFILFYFNLAITSNFNSMHK